MNIDHIRSTHKIYITKQNRFVNGNMYWFFHHNYKIRKRIEAGRKRSATYLRRVNSNVLLYVLSHKLRHRFTYEQGIKVMI